MLESTAPELGEYERLVCFDPPGARRALRDWLPGVPVRAQAGGDVVLGPAEDGGYYLIALREPRPALVLGVDWSTPLVLGQTLERVAAARLTVRQLERQHDVDTLADLRAVRPALAPRLRPAASARVCARAGGGETARRRPGPVSRRSVGWAPNAYVGGARRNSSFAIPSALMREARVEALAPSSSAAPPAP